MEYRIHKIIEVIFFNMAQLERKSVFQNKKFKQ